MIEHDLAGQLIGRDATDVEAIHDDLRWHIHYVGRGGVSAFAIAAIDVALWDLRGKATQKSLAKMAGGASDRCRAYCGGIDLNFPLPKLLSNIDGYLEAGFNGVKIKIGREDLDEDIARIKAVREHIGPDVAFMVDANYGMDVDKAIRAIRAFEPFDLIWFEEPGALKYLQPDVATCGGITTWMRAAELAESHGISVCSHGMQELHVSLLAGRPDSGWLEVHSFPIDWYTRRPLVVENQMAVAPDIPGIGVEFDWEKLKNAHDG